MIATARRPTRFARHLTDSRLSNLALASQWRNGDRLSSTGHGSVDGHLYFDDDSLVVESDTNGERVLATVDTGAVTTDLYENFAKQFTKLINKEGTKEKHDIRGVGNALTFDAVTLPRLPFTLGGMAVVLAPAHVMLKPIGNQRCVGNFGMDLFKQGRSLLIDLRAMRLQLTP